MSNDLIGAIIDTNTTDVMEPQTLPAGQWRFLIEKHRYNDDRKVLNFTLRCVDQSVPGIDMSQPVSRVEWALWLPNRATQDPAAFEGSRGMLKRVKKLFGILDGAPITSDGAQFIGRQVTAIIKERAQTPADIAQYGQRMDVDKIREVH